VSSDVVLEPVARLEIFGFQPTRAHVQVIARPKSWRVSRSLGYLALCWCALPVVALVPPHIPWVIGAFSAGIYFARKFWLEHFTLVSMRGTCPKCAHDLSINKPVRLKTPHVITCSNCQHQVLLYVDV
jgi:hypothetical protein